MSPWQNIQVKVQRRPSNPTPNVLNEPDYSDPLTWPVVNDPDGNITHAVRIEFNDENLEFTATGERIKMVKTLMYVSVFDLILSEDRITIVQSEQFLDSHLPNYFVVLDVWPEWGGAISNVNHYICDLQTL